MKMKIVIIVYHFKTIEGGILKGNWESIADSKVMIYRHSQYHDYLEMGSLEHFRLYLIYCEKKFGDADRPIIIQQVENIINKNIENEILLLLHVLHIDEDQQIWIENQIRHFKKKYKKVIGKDFSGGSKSDVVYEKIIDGNKELLHEELNIGMLNDLWKVLYTGTFADKIVDSLLTLHLALQAFFGISRDGDGKFKKIGNCTTMDSSVLNEILTNINNQRERENLEDGNVNILDEYKNLFPNPKAFLLVEESGYDFFSTLFEQLLPEHSQLPSGIVLDPNCHEEEDRYKMEMRFFRMLELIPKVAKLNDYCAKLMNGYEEETDEKIRSIREICAILANTIENENHEMGSKYFGYKGGRQSKEYRDRILKGLEERLKINFIDVKVKHSKVETNGKMHPTYINLAIQIANWGMKNAMIVIELVDELCELLSATKRT